MTTLEFPFLSGVDEETDDKILPAPRLTALENYRVVRPGSLECRAGVNQLGFGETNLDGPRRMIAHKDELLLIDDSKAYAFTTGQGFTEIEDSSAVVLESSRSLGAYARHSVVATACAATLQRLVHAWTTYDGTTYNLHVAVEEIGGSSLVQATKVPATSHAGMKCLKAASSGTSVIVMWGEGGNTIKGVVVDNNTAGAWEAGDIVTFASSCDQTALNFFDLDGHSTGVLLAYSSTTGSTVGLDRLDATGTSVASDTLNVGGATPRVGIVGDVGSDIHLHVVYGSGSGSTYKAYRLDTSWTVTASYNGGSSTAFDATLGISCGPYDSLNSAIVFGLSATSMSVKVGNAGAVPSLQSETIFHCYPCSKPFTRNGRVYVAVQARRDQANSHSALISVELSSTLYDQARLESRFNGSLVPSSPPDNIAVCVGNPYVGASSTSAAKDSAYIIPVRRVDRVSDPSLLGIVRDGVGIVSVVRAQEYVFNLNSGTQFMSAELGGKLYLGGGMVMQYDGRRLTEAGFSAYPDVQDSDIATSTGSGSVVPGDYVYAFVWEWYDAAGDRHQSPPQVRNVTVGASEDTVTIQCKSCPLTRKVWRLDGDDARPMVLAIYRSEVGGGTLYRLEGDGSAPFLENDPALNALGSYVDTYSDADLLLSTRELLYTTSSGANELDNVPPPPSRVIVAHGDRLVGISDEDPTVLWYSKSLRNESGLAWNETLVIPLEQPAKALASQDGNLLVFTAEGIYSIVGQGADNTGLGTGYDPPQRLSSETGCLDPRGVVTSPIGAFFRGPQGIMMAARGGFSAVHTQQIQQTLESYPVVTGAVHDQTNSRVCFSVVQSEDQTSDSRVLVYDYGSKLWSVYNYGDGFTIRDLCIDDDASGLAPDNAGLLCWASDGTVSDSHLVAREDTGFDDTLRAVSTFIDRHLETGDLRFGGIAGFARCSRAILMAEVLGSTDVSVLESHDSGATWDQTATWSLTASGEEFRQLTMIEQKHTQVRFRVVEGTSGTADSRGARFFGLRIDYTALPGSVLMTDTERT